MDLEPTPTDALAEPVNAALGVYSIEDEYWFIATSPQDAWDQCKDLCGIDDEWTTVDDVCVLSDAELMELRYTEDEMTTRSFFAQVEKLKSEGLWVRGFFAAVDH